MDHNLYLQATSCADPASINTILVLDPPALRGSCHGPGVQQGGRDAAAVGFLVITGEAHPPLLREAGC
jgi:hypothetical protein